MEDRQIQAWINHEKRLGEVRRMCDELGADVVIKTAMDHLRTKKERAEREYFDLRAKFDKAEQALKAADKSP